MSSDPHPSDVLPSRPGDEFPLGRERGLFDAVVRTAMDAIVAVDDQQRIVLFNRAAERMFGCESTEALGRPLDTFIPNRHRVAHHGYIEAFGRTGDTNRTMGFGTVYALRASGEEFPVEASISHCRVDGRQIFAAILRDLSESRKLELDRERLLKALEGRSAEMERFVYTVSHDLKSPLVTIKGFLGLLERDLAAGRDERVPGDLARIRTAADTMQHLLDDLLELSRIGRISNTPEPVSLTDIAQEAAALVAGRLSERGVALAIPADLPVVDVDRRRIVEVFQNLFDNAAKYMGEVAAPIVEVTATVDTALVTCRVRDNGMGIDPAYGEKIFGLFSKLDPRTEGTGIGLSIVKRVIETHGGRVWAESAGDGQGTTFVFTIPRARGTGETS